MGNGRRWHLERCWVVIDYMFYAYRFAESGWVDPLKAEKRCEDPLVRFRIETPTYY